MEEPAGGHEHRQLDALQRRTVHGHNSDGAFLSQQFWHEPAVETIWWDLDLLCQAMRKYCNRMQKRCHWLAEFNNRAAVDIPIRHGELPFQLWELDADQVPPQYLNRNIASSLAVYTFLAMSVDRSRSQIDSDFFLSSLVELVGGVCQSIETVAEGTIEVGTERVVIDQHGQVIGFKQCLSQRDVHVTIHGLLQRQWEVHYNAGNLVSPLTRDTQSLADILRFILTFARCRRAAGKQISEACSQFLVTWRRVLVAWFSRLADKFVLARYLNNAVSEEHAAPALQFQSPNKRKYTLVSAEAKWSTLEDARRTRASPTTVLAVKHDSPHLGCNEQAAESWMQKEQEMYLNRCACALTDHS
jgi:hypothetical protein